MGGLIDIPPQACGAASLSGGVDNGCSAVKLWPNQGGHVTGAEARAYTHYVKRKKAVYFDTAVRQGVRCPPGERHRVGGWRIE